MKPAYLILVFVLNFQFLAAQISFTDKTDLLMSDTMIYSGNAMGVVDMNNDSLDDIIQFHNADHLYVRYQQSDGSQFSDYSFGIVSQYDQWNVCVADVDSNGHNDILTGGLITNIYKANSTGDSFDEEFLPNPVLLGQGANFMDINNDGAVDIFSCDDAAISRPHSNDGFGNFTYDLSLINTASTIPSDNSGNYGSVWTDYDNDGDNDLYISKCKLGVNDPLDGRRVNLLFRNNGDGSFTEVAEAAGLRPLAQSWASDFGDIDNDGDMDCFVINHDLSSVLYLNNGDGTFSNITSSSGMASDLIAFGAGIQCIFEDFDNDSFLDLLVTGMSDQHRLFLNDGDLTFTSVMDAFPTNYGIHSAAVGDLDNDGALDVYAGFATLYNNPNPQRSDRVFINDEDSNNYLKILLKGDHNNLNAIGSRIEIYGDWGVQVREVRSGESFGIMNSFTAHFGLGSSTSVDSVVVRWAVGQINTYYEIDINQVTCIEDPCVDYLVLEDLVIANDTTFYAVNQIEIKNVFFKPSANVKFRCQNLKFDTGNIVSDGAVVQLIKELGCMEE